VACCIPAWIRTLSASLSLGYSYELPAQQLAPQLQLPILWLACDAPHLRMEAEGPILTKEGVESTGC
jgi:hypothetical protein